MKSLVVSAHNPMTGPRHLGHYVSTMIDWPNLQKEHHLVIIVDDLIATLLYPNARKEIQKRSLQTVKEFIATGIDLKENQIVLTSMIPEAHELCFFTSLVVNKNWCDFLYSESFAGILSSYERKQLGLPREASIAEHVYPQIHLATLTLALRANFFQGGEEMRGYLDIMEAISAGLGKFVKLKAPAFLEGSTTFLVGTDGNHMASENAIYLSDSEKEISKALSTIKSKETLLRLSTSLKMEKSLSSLVKEESLTEKSIGLFKEMLLEDLRKFRESTVSNDQIAEVLENSALIVRERLRETLIEIKGAFSIPGF